tara:strand:+ start:59 stop:370 length:312 start_codon:yes stop_codon:yes gene_type:complete
MDVMQTIGSVTLNAVVLSYAVGMLWTFLSWIRTIHETQAQAKMALDRRDRNLANALKQSARNTYAEGLWVVPVWPLVVVRNMRTVLEVRKSYKERKKAEKASR